MGQDDHSAWQMAIQHWFILHAKAWNIRVRQGFRVQTGATRFRVPDVSILDRSVPKELITTHPPGAVFEVLSPEDTIKRMKAKLKDSQKMGIPAIFMLDPETGIFERYVESQLTRVENLRTASTPNGFRFFRDREAGELSECSWR